MLNDLINWIKHKLDPHCPHCELSKRCSSCETLKVQLDILRNENKQLLELIVEKNRPINQSMYVTDDTEINQAPINLNNTAWRKRREILEKASRVEAARLREASKNGTTVSIEELEKVAGIKSEDNNDSGLDHITV